MFSTFTSSNVPKAEDNSLLTVTLSAVISLPDKFPIVAVADFILFSSSFLDYLQELVGNLHLDASTHGKLHRSE